MVSLSTRTAPAREGPPLILIVDDDPDNREVYSQFLRFGGFSVVTAVSGPEAVEKASRLNPDLIVMDVALPAMDGYQVTQSLRRSATTADIPVIALTGYPVEYSLDDALASGCTTYLTKPCLPKDLADVIDKVLLWKRLRMNATAARSRKG
jgi:two-component system, cell cycle response regulator DivK